MKPHFGESYNVRTEPLHYSTSMKDFNEANKQIHLEIIEAAIER